MTRMQLSLSIVTACITLLWRGQADAFTVQCASAERDEEITIACITTWGVGDVLAYVHYKVDSIAATLPPAALHTGQKKTDGAVTMSPNSVEHYIKHKPVNAFYVLSQKSTFRGLYLCRDEREDGGGGPYWFFDVTIKDYGRLLQSGGSGSIVGGD